MCVLYVHYINFLTHCRVCGQHSCKTKAVGKKLQVEKCPWNNIYPVIIIIIHSLFFHLFCAHPCCMGGAYIHPISHTLGQTTLSGLNRHAFWVCTALLCGENPPTHIPTQKGPTSSTSDLIVVNTVLNTRPPSLK